MGPKEYIDICDAAKDVPIISDEIYQGLVYEGKDHSVLEYTENAFVLNGFSKLYAMTGWRLGYLIAPKDCVRPLQKLQQNLFISANSFVQHGGVAALRGPQGQVREMVKEYDRRRKYMLKRLKEIGFGIKNEPAGAYYILANAKRVRHELAGAQPRHPRRGRRRLYARHRLRQRRRGLPPVLLFQ